MSDKDPNLFETTHWSIVRAAGEDSAAASEAMESLCKKYWRPLYAFIRCKGFDEHRAADLIQAFFVRVIEKDVLSAADRERGRFRSFLLAAVNNFLKNDLAKQSSARRGGKHHHWSLDFQDAEGRLANESVDRLTPEDVFHRQWALEVLENVLNRLAQEYRHQGNEKILETLRPYLNPVEGNRTYAEIAEDLGMTESNVKVAVHRLRKKYRKRLEQEIAVTIANRNEVDDEIRDLFEALTRRR